MSIFLCPREEITGPVFATVCTVLSVLENLPFSYSLLRWLLFFRLRKHNPFTVPPWTMSYGSLVTFSALFLRILFNSSAPNWTPNSSWALTNVGIVPCRLWSHLQPNIVLSLFSFLLCNSSTLPIQVQPGIHSNLYPFLKSCCATGCSPASTGVKSYKDTAQQTSWNYTPPLQPLCTQEAKSALAMLPHKRHQVACSLSSAHSAKYWKSIKDWASICINFHTLFALSTRSRVEKQVGLFLPRLKYPILCPCSVMEPVSIGSQA